MVLLLSSLATIVFSFFMICCLSSRDDPNAPAAHGVNHGQQNAVNHPIDNAPDLVRFAVKVETKKGERILEYATRRLKPDTMLLVVAVCSQTHFGIPQCAMAYPAFHRRLLARTPLTEDLYLVPGVEHRYAKTGKILNVPHRHDEIVFDRRRSGPLNRHSPLRTPQRSLMLWVAGRILPTNKGRRKCSIQIQRSIVLRVDPIAHADIWA